MLELVFVLGIHIVFCDYIFFFSCNLVSGLFIIIFLRLYSLKLTWHDIYHRNIFWYYIFSMHLLLWMNALLDSICMGMAEPWGKGSMRKIQNEIIIM